MLTATPSSSQNKPAFERLIQEATRGPSYQSTRNYALDHGIDEPALVEYATGAIAVYRRTEIENLLVRCEWARRFVVDWVKSKRKQTKAAA